MAEQKILGRDGGSFTSVVGYAGGSKTGSEGKVCYHNLLLDSDYGRLGHTEVVAVRVPDDRLLFFCEQYLRLFNSAGVRADPQDRGGEYRSAIGLPGGFSNPAVAVMQDFAGCASRSPTTPAPPPFLHPSSSVFVLVLCSRLFTLPS